MRIPLWVDTALVQCAVDGTKRAPRWFGRYLRLDSLRANAPVIIEFPVSDRVESWRTPGKVGGEWPGWEEPVVRDIWFRGNAVVAMSRPILPYSPLYKNRPEKYRPTKAVSRKVKRYVSPQRLRW